MKNQKELLIDHDAGFFSCCSVSLFEIIKFIKYSNCEPASVNFSKTFDMYKPSYPKGIISNKPTEGKPGFPKALSAYLRLKIRTDEDLYPELFNYDNTVELNINKIKSINFSRGPKFTYTDENLKDLLGCVQKWFRPSNEVLKIKAYLIEKYKINPEETIFCYYRGTDKYIEQNYIPAKSFSSVCTRTQTQLNIRRSLIQTDQEQIFKFLQNSTQNPFRIKENSMIAGKEGCHFLLENNRLLDLKYFFASILIGASCKAVVCNTSNVSRWIHLYRMNSDNFHQILEN